ncbi:hypothetical protein HA402_014057 [Bradysia odoriphaga]|nr:hypothetical protein HA402_014057 [Bradysia odoriphaga]
MLKVMTNFLDSSFVSTVERYYLTAHLPFWERSNYHLTKVRLEFVTSVHNRHIYVIGKHFIERFDPNSADGWIVVRSEIPIYLNVKVATSTPFDTENSSVDSVVTVGNDMYVTGSDDKNQKIVVRYNPSLSLWTDMPRLKVEKDKVRLVKCDLPVKPTV